MVKASRDTTVSEHHPIDQPGANRTARKTLPNPQNSPLYEFASSIKIQDGNRRVSCFFGRSAYGAKFKKIERI
jgi:hypothetical protein